MVKLLVWARKKEEMSSEEFRAYWTGPHAALARRTYTHLARYVINPVIRAPRGETALFDGLAELAWHSREDFDADVRSPVARAVAEDLAAFTSATGTLFVDEHPVVG
ncbi:MAG: EthD family reductase [Armatimonadetes bacterium]|nr:EthD family reductase [Armatimonadota bacterium]